MCSLKCFVLLYCQFFGHLKICIQMFWTIYGTIKAMPTLFASKERWMLQNQHNFKERCVVIAMLIQFANKEVHFESIVDYAWQQVKVHYESNASSILQKRPPTKQCWFHSDKKKGVSDEVFLWESVIEKLRQIAQKL